MSEASAVERLLDQLEAVKQAGERHWMARCPGHEDRTPSLSITEKQNGDVLVFCQGPCGKDLERTLPEGLTPRDLFAERSNGHREIAATYDYQDEHGELLFQVVRFEPKDFRQRRPDGSGGWNWSLNGCRRVLYHLPEVTAAVERGDDLFICEGEKDADALAALGVVATTNPAGAGKWRDEFSQTLRGAKVAVVADLDEPGRTHAESVARSLEGVAASVEVLQPAEGKDVSDHLAAGKSLGELRQFVSFTKGIGANETNTGGLPFAPLHEALAAAPPDPEWVWRGFLAPGAITLLAGRPKVGKSTLAFGLFRALGAGEPFLDLKTKQSGVLLLSEEREGTLQEKRHRFALGGSTHLLMRHHALGKPWAEVAEAATRYCELNGLGVLVIDTFDKWTGLGGDDENKAGAVLKALEPLQAAAGNGLAVLLVLHQRKASGKFGEAIRGSNAIAGGVDVILELERVDGEAKGLRVLRSVSRYTATPEEIAAELDGDEYMARGELAEYDATQEQTLILDAVSAGCELVEDIEAHTDLKKGTIRKRLRELYDSNRVRREGVGKKGDPHRFKPATEDTWGS